MPDFKLLDEARKVKESAATKAKELAEQAPSRTGELRAKTSDLTAKAGAAAAHLKEQVTDQVTQAMETGASRMTAVLDDLNSALPVLQEAGYPVDLLVLELGISPKILIRFAAKLGVKQERFNQLLEEHANHKMTAMLLTSLEKAKAIQSRIRVGDLKPKGIEIEIGVLPEVALRFG
jgi:hypothetical protein